jgi:hypothetical protein
MASSLPKSKEHARENPYECKAGGKAFRQRIYLAHYQ